MAVKERNVGSMFYSNCLLEALKAKIKDPKRVKLTYLPPTVNECFCPHWLWSDGEHDYDFGVERYLKWYERIWFKGHIRQRSLGFNEKWKGYRKSKKKSQVNSFEEYLEERE